MILLKKIHKKFIFLLASVFLFTVTNSCGFWDPADARKVPPSADVRVKKNLEEGKGFSIMGMTDGAKGGGAFQFASANTMWRATLEILDFLPLSNVDYSGGIVTTDWYNEGTSSNEAIKITIRFLSNEVRVDALSIKVFTKQCGANIDCQISENEGSLPTELKKNILKKAAIYEKQNKNKNFKEYQMTTPGDNKRE